jgi:hypothetical protein
MILPSGDEIRRAAYERFARRGRADGRDREDWYGAENELLFQMNYRTLVEYRLDGSAPLVLGRRPARQCRFCERTPHHVAFSDLRPAVPGAAGGGTLLSAEICDECQAECRGRLDDDFVRFWERLPGVDGGLVERTAGAGPGYDSVAVLKAVVASALLIMPETELPYFVDTLEWVGNPEPDYDGSLFDGTGCRVYTAPFLHGRAWTSLVRRVKTEAPLPYMIYFLAWRGALLQLAVPLCLRDQDLDGRNVRLPERSLAAGEGADFQETRSTVFPLVRSRARPTRAGHAARL